MKISNIHLKNTRHIVMLINKHLRKKSIKYLLFIDSILCVRHSTHISYNSATLQGNAIIISILETRELKLRRTKIGNDRKGAQNQVFMIQNS